MTLKSGNNYFLPQPMILMALVALSLPLALAGCEGKDSAARGAPSDTYVERQAGSVKEIKLRIDGMTWFAWAYLAKRALEGLEGVKKAEVSFSRGEARVQYDAQKVSIEAMIEAVREAGFQATLLPASVRPKS